jgi:hypothetical protein
MIPKEDRVIAVVYMYYLFILLGIGVYFIFLINFVAGCLVQTFLSDKWFYYVLLELGLICYDLFLNNDHLSLQPVNIIVIIYQTSLNRLFCFSTASQPSG